MLHAEEQDELGRSFLSMEVTSNVNNFKSAQKAFENVIEIYEKNEVPRSKLVQAYLNLAYSLQGQGDMPSSIGFYQKGIDLAKEDPESHHLLGEAYLNLGEVLHMTEKHPEAEQMVRTALPILEQKYGKQSEYYGAASSNLAVYICLQNDNRKEEALQHCTVALRVFERNFGRNNEHTVFALTNALRILKDLERNEEFEKLRNEFSEVDVDVNVEPPSEETLNKYYEEFLNTPKKKSFDPPGYVRSESMTKEQLAHFVELWKGQGLPLDFNFMDTVAKEFMLMDEQGPLYEQKSEDYLKNLALEQNKHFFDEETFNLLKQRIEREKESAEPEDKGKQE